MSGMLIGLAALFGIDQAAKAVMEKKFQMTGEKNSDNTVDAEMCSEDADKPEVKDIFGGKIRLRRLHNKGIMCGKLADHSDKIKYVSIGVTAVILAHFIVYMFHKETNGYKWAFTFILSGALSNTIDRIRHGYVVDYFSINTKKDKKKTLVYNLGDICLFIGALIAVVMMLFTSEK